MVNSMQPAAAPELIPLLLDDGESGIAPYYCIDEDGTIIIDTENRADEFYFFNKHQSSFVGCLSPDETDDEHPCVVCDYVDPEHCKEHDIAMNSQQDDMWAANTDDLPSLTTPDYLSDITDESFIDERAPFIFDGEGDTFATTNMLSPTGRTFHTKLHLAVRASAERAGAMVSDAENKMLEANQKVNRTTSSPADASHASDKGVTLRQSPRKRDRHDSAINIDTELSESPSKRVQLAAPPNTPQQDHHFEMTLPLRPAPSTTPSSISSSTLVNTCTIPDSDRHTLAVRLKRDAEVNALVAELESEKRRQQKEADMERKRSVRWRAADCEECTDIYGPLADDNDTRCMHRSAPVTPRVISDYKMQPVDSTASEVGGPMLKEWPRSMRARVKPMLGPEHEESWCYCGKPDDGERMFQCSNEGCLMGWFHEVCMKVRQIDGDEPWENGEWFCAACAPIFN